jgi:hypothetical protein
MRGWFSVPIAKGIRTGISINMNPAARRYHVSPMGAKVWLLGSALMLIGLAIWLVASRDQDGRLHESFVLVIGLVWGLRYLFGLAVVAVFPPIEPARSAD